MAKARGRRLLLGLLMLANMAVSSPLLTIPSANDVSDVGSDWSHTLRLSNSRTTSIKCSGFDEQYYEERGALDSQSSSSEEDNEEYDGTGIHAALNRAKQENDGEEGTNGDEQKASWQICVKRGNALMTLFGEPQIPKTEQSKFSAYSDLQKYGWTLEEKPFDPIAEDKFLIDPLDEINVAYDPKSGAKTWQRLVFTHDQETMGALGERIISVKVWSEQPNDDEWFKNYGPLLHMLFELSDAALVNDGPGAAEMSVQGVQEPLGPTMPQGSWSKPPAPIAEGQEDVTVQPSFSGGSAKSDARSIREDTMRRSEAQSSVGSRQNTDRSSRFHGGSRPSRRSRYRRNRRCSIKDHDQEDLDESRFPRQNEEEALHLLSEHDGGKNEADRSIMPSNRKLRQRDQSLPEDGGSRLQNRDDGSDAVSSCTERNEAPQANTVLRKLVRRMEPGPSSQPARFVPQPGERLPFVQSSASSPSQLTGYSFSAGPGPRPGQSFDSYVFKRAQEDGFYWIKRLGSDTLSPEDESQVPAMYDQGDYGYELDESWQLPREPLGFKGLGTLVPGFYDPQGRPNQDWTPMRWVHENQWVDDEDFKHHPLSAGMFENVYSPKQRAILYWSHVEPSRYAPKPSQHEPQTNKEEAAPANKPPPPESRAGMSSLTQDWEGFSIRQGEDGETDQKHDVNLHKHEGKQIAEEDMTPVRLPDTWMFDWVRVCKAAGHPVADLKHVIMPNVLETHTLEVLETLMEGRLEDWGPWPGKGFGIKHNEPILGTPLGVSVAKLIVQRHEMFGSERTLMGGNVWWTPPPAGSPEGTRGAVGLMLSLDDAPAELLQQQRAALPARDQAGSSQPGGTGKRPVTTPPKGQPEPKRPKPGVQ